MFFLRLCILGADHCNFVVSSHSCKMAAEDQTSYPHSEKGEGGREKGSTYVRKRKYLSEALERTFTYVTLARIGFRIRKVGK